jgi:REP element-mobilizing transposase RayT
MPVAIGGVSDHVHLLVRFGREITMADFVKETKRVSNQWLKREGAVSRQFRWQAGYGAFSVSESQLERAIRYVQNQERHHRKLGFQDEMRKLFAKHRIEFDERYVWD